MKNKNIVIDNIKFTPDCQNKWDFDGPIIVVSSRGYDRNEKSFYVGYYLVTETDEDNLYALCEELHKNGIKFGMSNVFDNKGIKNQNLKVIFALLCSLLHYAQ